MTDRILVYSDLHLHCWTAFNKPQGAFNGRLLLQREVLDQIIRYALDEGITTIVCCGDVFHTQGKVDADPLSNAYWSFSYWNSKGIEQIWLTGNHDQKDRAGHLSSLDWMNELGHVIRRDDTMSYADRNWKFLSYVEDKDELQKFFDECGPEDICFIHQGVGGLPQKSGYVVDEIFTPDMASHVRHVFAGHYHDHKTVGNITIPGAPMQHTWGDVGEKRGWLDVTIPNEGPLEIVHVESDHPKFGVDWKANESVEVEEDIVRPHPTMFADLGSLVAEHKKGMDTHTQIIGDALMGFKYEIPSTKN